MRSFVLQINPQLIDSLEEKRREEKRVGLMNSEGPKLLFLLAPVFVFCCCDLRAVAARDTITAGNPLTGNQSIISENGDFELSLPGADDFYYNQPTIIYKKYEVQVPVWSIYIDGTVPTTDMRLNISGDGNLILLSNDGSLIWSTGVASPVAASNSTVAVLLDSGNLVLRYGLNSSNVLWQSFDHPTDTWLPGAPLGFDRSTGNHIFLTSFAVDPSYYFSVDEETVGSPQFVLQNKEPGEYDDLSVQHLAVPTMIDIHQDSQKGTFTFHAIDGYTIIILDRSSIGRYICLENSSKGCVFQFSYPFSSCGVGLYCGPFGICDTTYLQCMCPQGFSPTNPQSWGGGDYSSGCRRVIPLSCQNTSSGYSSYYLEKLPDNSQRFFASDDEECASACTSNCSCTAYSFNFDCELWHGNLLNLTQCDDCSVGSVGSVVSIRAEIDSRRRNKHPERSHTGLIIGAVLGTATVLAIGLIVAWRCKKRSRAIDIEPIYSKSNRVFSYSDLKSATKNFSKKLGQGSFGSVFMGTLRDSTLVAVKKLQGLRQGEKQFRAEVITVGMIQHINIVRLFGFCAEGTKRLLVYEYMPNGSLDSHLFSKTSDILDWNLRYRIAIGIARGLAYLHEKCKDFIIHCDIKPENILLDEHFCPRIADFGMAKLFTRDGSRVLTTMRGTIGYLAPEWISGLAITHKADVYSFGMMLFEIISGRRNTERPADGTYVYFPTWAAAKIHEGEVLCLLDSKLRGEVNSEELDRACRIACWCIQQFESSRPSMGQVVQMLEGVQEVNMPPIPTFLCNFVCDENGSTNRPTLVQVAKDLVIDTLGLEFES